MQLATQKMVRDELERHLTDVIRKRLEKCRGELSLSAELTRRMQDRIEKSRQELRLRKDLQTAARRSVEHARHELALAAAGLERMSPATRLSGGYGFLTDAEGKPVAGVAGLRPGDALHIRLRDGCVHADVREIEAEDVTVSAPGGLPKGL